MAWQRKSVRGAKKCRSLDGSSDCETGFEKGNPIVQSLVETRVMTKVEFQPEATF